MGQLVLIIDTSSAMVPYWREFSAGYVTPIIKFFSDKELGRIFIFALYKVLLLTRQRQRKRLYTR